MLFERIKSPRLAHFSYLIGDDSEAVVIDSKRAVEEGYKITKIFETYRNGDYIVGSTELKAKTGAEIWHADEIFNYQYGKPVQDGQEFKVGSLKIEAIHTPGHSPGSMSYILYGYEGEPLMVFTGDALFAGDVGRIDLLGKKNLDKTVNWLYDSIFNKILPLGYEVILCFTHGPGSVCGTDIFEREWTTVGIERKFNPKLQIKNKEEFISLVAKMMEYPPYFANMEELNLTGTEPLANYEKAAALLPDEFAEVIKSLYRTGFDNILGYLSGGIIDWHMAGKPSLYINIITADKLCKSFKNKHEEKYMIDVRSGAELLDDKEVKDAVHIHLTQLPHHYDEAPEDKPVYIFCRSGLRSMTAASLLKSEGFINQSVVLGGMVAWNTTNCQ
ncbi:MAG: MBL fold metallo-hydrolase [Bacillota bacterium]